MNDATASEWSTTTSLIDFAERLRNLLVIDYNEDISPLDGLFDTWGLDSLQGFEVIVLIEGMAGADVPPIEIPQIFTVQDAFEYYESLRAAKQAESASS